MDVIHAATNNRNADGNDIRLVNLGPIALFSSYKLTTTSGKHLKNSSHTQIVSLMYKLETSAKITDDLSIGFDRDRTRRQQELTINKNQKGKFRLRFMLKDFSGFAENQDKATYGLGYKLASTKVVITLFGLKKTQPTLVKMKSFVMNGMYRFIHPVFHNKLYLLNRFCVKFLQNFKT